ncbi:MAG: sigma-70 family RNA polymerase sigma factor [Brevundimonas sp.]|nr:MAG: sigma-70 family RNA polymerase sigma factor [Brevundimonas sp.]
MMVGTARYALSPKRVILCSLICLGTVGLAGRTSEQMAATEEIEALYQQYAGWFRARLVRRFGTDVADDLMQETWLRLVPTGGAAVRYPKALLMRIASNIATDVARRRARHNRDEAQAAFLSAERAQSSTQIDEVSLRGLPQPLRDVFVMSRFGGLTHAQIAEQLGISPKTVEWRMTKALAHCAAQLRA